MSTKTVTTQANQYNPQAMNAYTGLQPNIASNWQNDMQLDPRKSSTFNLALQNAFNGNQRQVQNQMGNMFSNMRTGGFNGNMNAYTQSQLGRIGRFGAGLNAQSTNQNFLNYDMMRRQATAQAAGYRPLQTGATNTQQTSGLGTWLPQVIGAGASIAAGAMTGGMSGALGGLSGSGGSMMGKGAGAPTTFGDFNNSPYMGGMIQNYNGSSPYTWQGNNPNAVGIGGQAAGPMQSFGGTTFGGIPQFGAGGNSFNPWLGSGSNPNYNFNVRPTGF